jgi:hypothetical protein
MLRRYSTVATMTAVARRRALNRENLIRRFIIASLAGVLVLPFSATGSGADPATGTATPAARATHDRPGDFVISSPAKLYEHPSLESRVLRRLRTGTRVRVIEIVGDWYRVHSSHPGHPDGYVQRSHSVAAPAYATGRRTFRPGIFRVTRLTPVHATPNSRSRTITQVHGGAKVHVVGEEGRWYRIESWTGRRPPGYIIASATRRLGNL